MKFVNRLMFRELKYNDIKQHYPDQFYNPGIDRLYRLKEFIEGTAE